MRPATAAVILMSCLSVVAMGGDAPAWPEVLRQTPARFVRLRHAGTGWDAKMGQAGDYNLLLKYKEFSELAIAPASEAVSAANLLLIPRQERPSFLYLTGMGKAVFSTNDIAALRAYCLEYNGMLFIDNAGGVFHQSVLALMRDLFPSTALTEISNDDPLYQKPFRLPSGAPPLWHHSGNQVLGISHSGRWVVVYHQGDLGDAWQTGHSGASLLLAEKAYQFGINVLCYAYDQMASQMKE